MVNDQVYGAARLLPASSVAVATVTLYVVVCARAACGVTVTWCERSSYDVVVGTTVPSLAATTTEIVDAATDSLKVAVMTEFVGKLVEPEAGDTDVT